MLQTGTFDDKVQRAGLDPAKALLYPAGAHGQGTFLGRCVAPCPPRRCPRSGFAGTGQLTRQLLCLSRTYIVDHVASQDDPHIAKLISMSSFDYASLHIQVCLCTHSLTTCRTTCASGTHIERTRADCVSHHFCAGARPWTSLWPTSQYTCKMSCCTPSLNFVAADAADRRARDALTGTRDKYWWTMVRITRVQF